MSESGPEVLLLEQFESQVLGGRVSIPGPDDEVKATFAQPLSSWRGSPSTASSFDELLSL